MRKLKTVSAIIMSRACDRLLVVLFKGEILFFTNGIVIIIKSAAEFVSISFFLKGRIVNVYLFLHAYIHSHNISMCLCRWKITIPIVEAFLDSVVYTVNIHLHVQLAGKPNSVRHIDDIVKVYTL